MTDYTGNVTSVSTAKRAYFFCVKYCDSFLSLKSLQMCRQL